MWNVLQLSTSSTVTYSLVAVCNNVSMVTQSVQYEIYEENNL